MKPPRRFFRTDNRLLRCAFCDEPNDGKLWRHLGSGKCICDSCVGLAAAIAQDGVMGALLSNEPSTMAHGTLPSNAN